VLAINILPLFSNGSNSHVHKIRTGAFKKMANSNLVDLLVGLNSEPQQDYGTKMWERKNGDNEN
jgi:hypothetical protein